MSWGIHLKIVSALPLLVSSNSLLFVLSDGGVRSWDPLEWGVSSWPSLSASWSLSCACAILPKLKLIQADVCYLLRIRVRLGAARLSTTVFPCHGGVPLRCPCPSCDLQCGFVVLTVNICEKLSCTCLRSPKVLKFIIVLLELCVVDCKEIKLTGCVGISQCGTAGE